MPPADSDQPSSDERSEIGDWLFSRLTQHARIGGTLPRRLNREEYENTVRDLFEYPEFSVPDSFPSDDSAHGFDNVAQGLVLSPPLMAAYLTLATEIADEILPPNNGPKKPDTRTYEIAVDDLTNYRDAGVTKIDDIFRLVSSKNMANSAAWPNRFEAPQSGTYRLTINARVFQTDEMFYAKRKKPFQLGVYSRPKTERTYDPMHELPRLASMTLSPNSTNEVSVEIELVKGHVFGIRWEDGPCVSAVPSREYAKHFFDERLEKNRRHYAAMLKLGPGTRGMTQKEFYEKTVELMNGTDLDLQDPRLDTLPEEYGGGLAFDKPFRFIKNYVHEEMLRFGPAVDLTAIKIEGPFELTEDDETRKQAKRTSRFLGKRGGETDREYVKQVLRRFLSSAFRRPVNEKQLDVYVALAIEATEADSELRIQDALHLAVRRALVSPHFLYRSLPRPASSMDDFDLASRLSYFLTSGPPDSQLIERASTGTLSNPDVLAAETQRLLDSPHSQNFVSSFTGQWLGTRNLQDIMPDPRLMKFFEPDRKAMIDETEMFFTAMLKENRLVSDFIDPGFSYRNANLNKIYGGELEGREMRRVSFERGGREGGVLSLASVMMATANGVDTHPVHRGVWLLENVFGTPTPSPPGNIPAIAPDTTGKTTIRSQLDAHRADASCARCHEKIDPLGMVLESFDPVGRWREHYPVYVKPKDGEEKLKEEFYSTIGEGVLNGPKIDANGELPSGEYLKDVTDLKRHVLKNIGQFSKCLTEKLLVYATGRPLNFADRRVVEKLVGAEKNTELRFRDLIVAIVNCDSFQAK